MLGATIGIGVFAGLSAVGIFGKAGLSKWLGFVLFVISVFLYFGVIVKQLEFECQIIGLVLVVCVMPAVYLGMISWNYAAAVLCAQICIVGCFLVLAKYYEFLDKDLTLNILNTIDQVVQLIAQVICSYFVIAGYSHIPELLITPPIEYILKKANYDYLEYTLSRAKSNISFKYTCRGLPTPKFEKKNLKTIEREHEKIEDLISKFEKSPLKYKTIQFLSISSGCLTLCIGFWTLTLLIGILVENIAVSSCGITCGFTSKSRISSIISDYELAFSICSGAFYLICSIIGYLQYNSDSFKDLSTQFQFGLIFTSVSSSFSIKTLLAFFYPSSFTILFRPLQFILNGFLIGSTFLYFIYWNFFKCKKR